MCSAARSPCRTSLLGNHYGAVTLGQPLAAASTLNRLQCCRCCRSSTPADFEAGAGFRISGATTFPRQMAMGARRRRSLALRGRPHHGDRIARASGVHVNFAPVADVNNNARNPVINTRAFGEQPGLRRPPGGRVRPRSPRRRHARDAEALSRARRHGRGLAPRVCRSSSTRASGSTASSSRRSARAWPPAPTRS